MIARALRQTALALLLAVPGQGAAQQPVAVDLELVLAIDVSGSVAPWEFALQVQGIAEAFRDPAVHAAIEGGNPNGIAVVLMQWSGPTQYAATTDWTLIDGAAAATEFAARIDSSARRFMGRTAIADALRFSTSLLTSNPFQGHRQVVDVSGDGRSNEGAAPSEARDAAVAANITINGLAILTDVADLDRYYRDQIIGGPDAFLLTVLDYSDFVQAIRKKLIREISGAPLADVAPELPGASPAS